MTVFSSALYKLKILILFRILITEKHLGEKNQEMILPSIGKPFKWEVYRGK